MTKLVLSFILITCFLLCSCDEKKSENIIPSTINIVKIGTQVWMKKNLDVDKYRNGDPIPQVKDASQWTKLKSGAWCYYHNDPATGKIYGKLYNWFAVNDPRGLAPEGWHIATDEEWTALTGFLGSDSTAGGKLKESGTTHWQKPNTGATNESGFTALPGGYRLIDGTFNNIGKYGYWWTSTKSEIVNPWYRNLTYIHSVINRNNGSMKGETAPRSVNEAGFSVRCVKD
jgi:uncharacterized protein (TIGR02145 family)